MKVACVVDEDNMLSPLEYGSSIFLIDDETKRLRNMKILVMAEPMVAGK